MEVNILFERYSMSARKVIFFTRFEAGLYGADSITPEHLLLGLARQDPGLLKHFLSGAADHESLDSSITVQTPKKPSISTSVDLPLSNECKRALDFTQEEATQLGSEYIGPEHLLLGLLREEGCTATQLLIARGARLAEIRTALAANPWQGSPKNERSRSGSRHDIDTSDFT